jgi:hypothetical protein
MSKRINLSEFIERKRTDDSVTIDLPDGTSVVIPPPLLWPDSVSTDVESNDGEKVVEAILGADAERFRANGGTFKLLAAIFAEAKDVDMGEAPASPGS